MTFCVVWDYSNSKLKDKQKNSTRSCKFTIKIRANPRLALITGLRTTRPWTKVSNWVRKDSSDSFPLFQNSARKFSRLFLYYLPLLTVFIRCIIAFVSVFCYLFDLVLISAISTWYDGIYGWIWVRWMPNRIFSVRFGSNRFDWSSYVYFKSFAFRQIKIRTMAWLNSPDAAKAQRKERLRIAPHVKK